jgi:hypothetical protein
MTTVNAESLTTEQIDALAERAERCGDTAMLADCELAMLDGEGDDLHEGMVLSARFRIARALAADSDGENIFSTHAGTVGLMVMA